MKTSAILIVLCARLVFGALSTTVVWEVRPTNGDDTFGGGFDPGVGFPGTDFSQQNSAQVTYTDLVIGGTASHVTSALNPFGSTFPGNIIHITGGAGCTTGWYEILLVSGTDAQLDRVAGTSTSVCTGKLGGALKTLTQLNTNMSLDQQAWAKAESTLSSGRINWTVSGGTGFASIQGYTTTRGDGGYFTTVINVNDYFWVMTQSANITFKNFILDHNNQAGGDVILLGGCCTTLYNISVINSGVRVAFNLSAGDRSSCSFCYATGASGNTNAFVVDGGIICYACVAYSNTLTNIVFNLGASGGGQPGGVCIRCIAANNTSSSAAFGPSTTDQAPFYLINSIAVNNGGDGAKITNHLFPVYVLNNIFVSNSGFGINSTTSLPAGPNVVMNNAFFGNTSGARNNVPVEPGDVTLAGNPFTNSAGNDFSLTSGVGSALYGVGLPGPLTIGGTGYLDIGALQHQAAAGGITGSPIQ